MVRPHDFVVSLRDVDHDDKYHVGEHAAKLASVGAANFSILPGFVVTSSSYFKFLDENNLNTKIKHLLGATNFDREDSVSQISQHIKKLIKTSPIPDDLVNEIVKHYENIGGKAFTIKTTLLTGDHEQHTVLEEKTLDTTYGDAVLLDSIRNFWSTLFSPAMLFHRNEKNIDHLRTGIAATVQKAIDATASGRVFSYDRLASDTSRAVIELPMGHNILVDKASNEIFHRKPNNQPVVFMVGGKPFHAHEAISQEEAVTLAKIAGDLEKHFYLPQEVSWIKDKNSFYITSINSI